MIKEPAGGSNLTQLYLVYQNKNSFDSSTI
jgi:hypothetical protein